jgi:hypothetical protein
MPAVRVQLLNEHPNYFPKSFRSLEFHHDVSERFRQFMFLCRGENAIHEFYIYEGHFASPVI